MPEPYSDKVLEYFKNPKNMGKIENPDGIGKVGNPVCLGKDEIIHINSNVKKIDSISLNDRVIGCSGLYRKVGVVAARNYRGKVLLIKNRMGQTLLTPEHMVLAKKVPYDFDKFKRTAGKKQLPHAWYHAADLDVKDVILYPIFKENQDKQYIELDCQKRKFDYQSKQLPKKIYLNADFLRLCGYYLAKGHCSDKVCKRNIGFTFNSKESEYVEDVIAIVKKIWDLPVNKRVVKKHKTIQLTVNNVFLVKFFKENFGDRAENKKIPDFLMSLPLEKQKHLICGLWRGDGFVDFKKSRAGYATISFKLISQLKLLLLRQRIIPSIYTEKAKVVDGVRHKISYRMHVADRWSFQNLSRILGAPEHKFKSFVRQKVWIDDDFVYLPITQIIKKQYKGKVYNLEVPGDHSFITNSVCVHNCGDVMWIYIKVKDGVITDCTFETFGCVAAIATSSVLTELVKGKTLDDALKVSNKDVVAALGGLPHIKMHCSVLAEEGIRAAIEDYRKKQVK
jgi:nitrogen fixation NifU-like protein